jgi:hypothetical protein
MKRCYACGETKTTDQFYPNRAQRDGLGTDCKKCRIAGERDRYVRMRARMESLKDKPCMDCGGSFPVCCMDYDHRDPSLKSFAVGQYHAINSWTKMLEEISKCDLVCANCHRIRTQKQIDSGRFKRDKAG